VQFWRCCEPDHWKGEETFDRPGNGAVRSTRDERPFRDGSRRAPASQRFALTGQTPLKTGEIRPRTGGLNGFERVIVAEGMTRQLNRLFWQFGSCLDVTKIPEILRKVSDPMLMGIAPQQRI